MKQTDKQTDLLDRSRICAACPAIVDKAILLTDDGGARFLRVSIVNESSETLIGAAFTVIFSGAAKKRGKILKIGADNKDDAFRMRVRFPAFTCAPGECTACRLSVPEEAGEIASYEIIIDRVETVDGELYTFDEDDYIVPEIIGDNFSGRLKNAFTRWYSDKKLFTVSLICASLVLVCAVATVVVIGRIKAEVPAGVKPTYADYIAANDYDGAIAFAEEKGDVNDIPALYGEAARYYFGAGEVGRALGYASRADAFDYTDFYGVIFNYYSSEKDFAGGLAFAAEHAPDGVDTSAVSSLGADGSQITDNQTDAEPPLETAGGDTPETDVPADTAAPVPDDSPAGVFRAAFNSFIADAVYYYLNEGDSASALEYAGHYMTDGSGGQSGGEVLDILEDAVNDRITSGNWEDAYGFAVRVRESYPLDTAIDPDKIAKKAVDAYVYARDFEKAVYFANLIPEDTEARKTALVYAVVYYTSEAGLDYARALSYAEEYGDAAVLADTQLLAVDYYLEQWKTLENKADAKAALEAAEAVAVRASGSTAESLNVKILNAKAISYYNDGSYDLMLRCLKDINETEEGVADAFFAEVPLDYERRHMAELYPLMSPASKRVFNAKTVSVWKYAAAVGSDGVMLSGTDLRWNKLVSLDISENSILGLSTGGAVYTWGANNAGELDVTEWTGIVDIAAGLYHSVGLRASGLVASSGMNDYGQCDTSSWTDVYSVAAGAYHTVGLKSDGTVVAAGLNTSGQCEVDGWTDIIAVECGSYHTVGLRKDGTVVCAGDDKLGKCGVSEWKNIVSIAAGDCVTAGLRSDGTVVTAGRPVYGSAGDTSSWSGIVEIYAGSVSVYGLKADGTVVSTGDGAADVSGYKNVRLPDGVKNENS